MKRLNRRQFVASLGACAATVPFLNFNLANAQQGSGPTRLAVFFTPNGTIPSRLGTTGSGTSYSFEAGSILEPLAPIKDDLIVLRNLEFKNATNHEGGMKAMLTGNGGAGSPTGGMSLDQFIASEIGAESRFSSLEFGVQTSAWGANVQTRMSYTGPDQYAGPDDDPASVYRRLFGDGPVADGEPVDRRLQRRLSILDLNRQELKAIQSKLGAQEKAKLEEHLESVRTVERRLGGVVDPIGGADCEPAPLMALNTQDAANFPAIGQAQMDLMITALACGHTNVASIQWSHTVANTVFTWLGITDGHHDLSHYDAFNDARVQDYVDAERWYSEQFLYLVQSLASRPDPVAEGTMLDNTIVLWAQELGDGRNHVCTDVPWVIAGGGLNTGRLIDAGGDSHQGVMVAICQALGIDIQIFGDPAHGAGALDGILA